MSGEQVLTDARLILRDEEMRGTVVLRDGMIAEIDSRPCGLRSAERLEGAWLTPGLVELHTDNLERHMRPRPGVNWPNISALMAHDSELIAAGITTVLDAICVGTGHVKEHRREILDESIGSIRNGRDAGVLRADHRLHLRCEVSDEDTLSLFEPLSDEPLLQLVSLMDHTPGQRQFADFEKFRTYYKGHHGMTDDEIDAMTERSRAGHEKIAPAYRHAIAANCREREIPLASHDDATEEHVETAAELGLTICEFPTTEAAARAARARGMKNIMGAPNLVRGGSHSGNISASALAAAGLLDALSSDYVPFSLLYGAVSLNRKLNAPMAQAFGAVTWGPAEMIGLDDRGEIAPGKRADLVAFEIRDDMPVVHRVWHAGRLVH